MILDLDLDQAEFLARLKPLIEKMQQEMKMSEFALLVNNVTDNEPTNPFTVI